MNTSKQKTTKILMLDEGGTFFISLYQIQTFSQVFQTRSKSVIHDTEYFDKQKSTNVSNLEIDIRVS